MGRTTLHRFPDICEQIRAFSAAGPPRERTKTSAATQRATAAKREILELKRQVSKLLEQNMVLTMRLSKYEDPSLPAAVPIVPRSGKS